MTDTVCCIAYPGETLLPRQSSTPTITSTTVTKSHDETMHACIMSTLMLVHLLDVLHNLQHQSRSHPGYLSLCLLKSHPQLGQGIARMVIGYPRGELAASAPRLRLLHSRYSALDISHPPASDHRHPEALAGCYPGVLSLGTALPPLRCRAMTVGLD